jgi:hypothetical protein
MCRCSVLSHTRKYFEPSLGHCKLIVNEGGKLKCADSGYGAGTCGYGDDSDDDDSEEGNRGIGEKARCGHLASDTVCSLQEFCNFDKEAYGTCQTCGYEGCAELDGLTAEGKASCNLACQNREAYPEEEEEEETNNNKGEYSSEEGYSESEGGDPYSEELSDEDNYSQNENEKVHGKEEDEKEEYSTHQDPTTFKHVHRSHIKSVKHVHRSHIKREPAITYGAAPHPNPPLPYNVPTHPYNVPTHPYNVAAHHHKVPLPPRYEPEPARRAPQPQRAYRAPEHLYNSPLLRLRQPTSGWEFFLVWAVLLFIIWLGLNCFVARKMQVLNDDLVTEWIVNDELSGVGFDSPGVAKF